mmetsp:Transcript_19693/g.29219  ORF Transcript_19693/g.29219 Transcript_19693/m.29219 type:complete len:793 (+) Transcript_19693:2-2380(+)
MNNNEKVQLTPRKRVTDHVGNEKTVADHATPLRRYLSRKISSTIRTNDLPVEPGYVGHFSGWGIFYSCILLSVPIAYIYIFFILLREFCVAFPHSLYSGIQRYIPHLAWVVSKMERSSMLVEVWCIIEGIFYIIMKLRIQWLQTIDPLETSLSAAPMMDRGQRAELWSNMMEMESPIDLVSGWFFDMPIEDISRYDIRDWICWSMFEGRNLEHLTSQELNQLEAFVESLEKKISYELYGEVVEEEERHDLRSDDQEPFGTDDSKRSRKKSKDVFRFPELSNEHPPNFFATMYDNYKQTYERARSLLEDTDPVQDLRNMMAEAEEKTMATASHMYENASTTATHMASNAYENIIGTGSNIDKQLSAISHAAQQQVSELSTMTQQQLAEAWKVVMSMKERLDSVEFLSNQTQRVKQQLKGYRVVLNRMREMSSSVPSRQMAQMMRRVTECNDAMERLETRAFEGLRAMDEFSNFASKTILGHREPKRYAKYSCDPLLGVGTFPLGFQILVVGATEIPLRIMMRNRGFERLRTGSVAYYYHPGKNRNYEKTPLVFVHGIGIGLIMYIALIDCLLKTGRPILIPEIPYVCGFRPYQLRNSVLPPAVVCSTIIEMLAKHGYLRASFIGHSYGTTWLAYMCKYAAHAIAALLFLDPVCFCLHLPRLTKQFVYHQPDIGTIAYFVRTDVIVNWTIQRSFPWSWIVLFYEQIKVPCSVFLSEKDMLVPAIQVQKYLSGKGAPTRDYVDADDKHFASGDINVTIFRGDEHGGWTERADVCPVLAACAEVLCVRAEGAHNDY